MTQQIPEGAQRSEDGNYWWDGSQWQPVAASQGQAQGQAQAQAQAQGIQLDLQQFPGLWRLSQTDPSDAGVDQYLAQLGIDPNKHEDSDTATA